MPLKFGLSDYACHARLQDLPQLRFALRLKRGAIRRLLVRTGIRCQKPLARPSVNTVAPRRVIAVATRENHRRDSVRENV